MSTKPIGLDRDREGFVDFLAGKIASVDAKAERTAGDVGTLVGEFRTFREEYRANELARRAGEARQSKTDLQQEARIAMLEAASAKVEAAGAKVTAGAEIATTAGERMIEASSQLSAVAQKMPEQGAGTKAWIAFAIAVICAVLQVWREIRG